MLHFSLKIIATGLFTALLFLLFIPSSSLFSMYGDIPQDPWQISGGIFILAWVGVYFAYDITKGLSLDLENDAERAALEGLQHNINEMRQDPDIAPMAIARTLLEEAERIIQADTENSAARAELAPLNNRIRAALEPVRT